MRKPSGVIVFIAALAVAGCAELQQARNVVTETGARAGAKFVVAQCARLSQNRQQAHAALIQEIRALGSPANVTPFDCDGVDGPDF